MALLWICLHEEQSPEEMTWLAIIREEVPLVEHLPEYLNNKQTCPEELLKLPCPSGCRFCGRIIPVLDVTGQPDKIWHH